MSDDASQDMKKTTPEEISPPVAVPPAGSDEPDDSTEVAVRRQDGNDYFRKMMDVNFLEYASYVIKDRAIPDVDDGLKPVQRRILWALYQVYDGRTHKVANIVGNTMHFHPHGDASINDALVVLANKDYYIDRQGNFGNILTGSPAAAGRYIECSLSLLGHEVLFNNDITEFVDSYDGRTVEPVTLPAKVPSLLMLGSDGIAVGMATKIMPHNFNELLRAEIAELRGEPFELYPDFQQGGLMDVRDYADGNGRIVLRAKIDIEGRELVIREIPATTTTESLVASIEKAAEKNKIRISSINDYTTGQAEIRIVPTRGYDPEKTRQGLYMYTKCSDSISVNMTVIRENRPVTMTVSEVLKRNVVKLLEILKRELEIDLGRQNELFHAKTLAQIFFENRIYKRIEECRTQEAEYKEVREGLAPFLDRLRREVTENDIDKLLALPVRRISRFDIEKNQRELAEIEENIAAIRKRLAHLTNYAIEYLEGLITKYGKNYPRHTEIEKIERIDRHEAALNNIKVGWDRKNGYIGTAIKSDEMLACNEFDRFICVEKSGAYRVIALPPEKMFVGKMYDFRRYDAENEFGVIYRETKSGKYYGKRSSIGGFIMDKQYMLCPPGCKIELLTPRADAIYVIVETTAKGKNIERELNLMELPLRSPKARGMLIGSKPVSKISHSRYLSEEELAAFTAANPAPEEPADNEEEKTTTEAEPEVPVVAEPVAEPETPPVAEPEVTVAVEPVAVPEVTAAVEPTAETIAEPEAEIAPSATDELIDPAALPVEEKIRKPRRKREAVKAAPEEADPDQKQAVEPKKSDASDDDEFGIVQQEFGF